ncbi:MAG: hypothetical protein J3K34DRAFT_421380 [Monoraphidium minutum]|nr:MAG: hypothetical protein J3K34DRAFT_421380 [Monoraphidium minutum]
MARPPTANLDRRLPSCRPARIHTHSHTGPLAGRAAPAYLYCRLFNTRTQPLSSLRRAGTRARCGLDTRPPNGGPRRLLAARRCASTRRAPQQQFWHPSTPLPRARAPSPKRAAQATTRLIAAAAAGPAGHRHPSAQIQHAKAAALSPDCPPSPHLTRGLVHASAQAPANPSGCAAA